MKRLAFVALLLTAGSALAQPMEEVTADDTIELGVRQSRTFTFDKSVNRITLSADGVAQVIPEDDRTFNIRGLTQGQTLMTAYASGGGVLYRANIAVLQAGELVKIYGQGDMEGKPRIKDYVGFQCTELGCGRADTDKVPAPFSTTLSQTKSGPDGSSTVSREYRP